MTGSTNFLVHWMVVGGSVLLVGWASSFSSRLALTLTVSLATMTFMSRGGTALRKMSEAANPSFRSLRRRNRDAGRWLGAPVAELDKSTIGKLLTSRASRDPSLHVVVSRPAVPDCSDALYDPELDGLDQA